MAREVQPGTRRRVIGAALFVGAIAVLGAVAFVGLRTASERRADRFCAAINEPVAGLNGLRWDNGMTESGSTWASVLTDGVESLATGQQAEVATAVAADDSGWEQLLDVLDADDQALAVRLKALLVDPIPAAEHRDNPSTVADVTRFRHMASENCGGLY